MKLPEISINIGGIRKFSSVLHKVEKWAADAQTDAAIYAGAFSSMIFHHTNEVEIVKDNVDNAERVIKFNPGPLTALGLSSDIAMQLSLTAELIKAAGSQALCRTTQTTGLITQSAETVGDLQIQSRRLAARLPVMTACQEYLARKKRAIGTSETRLLQKPGVTTEEMALQFRLQRVLAKQEKSLQQYAARIVNGAIETENRATGLGVPETIIAAAMVSGWLQGGLPEEKIDRGITDKTFPGKLTFAALSAIRFEE